jgi:superfamily II DNA or RNA helicase
MGLTATPTYTEKEKRGWLLKLFPQGIIYQVSPQTLMAAGVLAKPVFEEERTSFEANFDEREYEKWVNTNRDLPDDIISSLASSRERNEYIVGCYVKARGRYGKTIIFADRWQQCVQLAEAMKQRGVKADAIYSHVDANPGSVEARNRRTAGENGKVLQDFRDGKLDVLINIRMATEGTDVPDAQTVFLTRQTTSQILLTQMVGRALRGPKFGGTDNAFIVSFIDNWKHRIKWAEYDQIAPGLADDTIPEYGKRPPLELVSIELVRRLARQMDSGININPGPYKSFLPIGWYRVDYYAQIEGTEDVEPISQLVMVFEGEEPAFRGLIQSMGNEDLSEFEEDSVRLADVRERVREWHEQFFSDGSDRVGGEVIADLFSIARHIAQNEGQSPKFFPFDVRDQHDLDIIAKEHVESNLGDKAKNAALKAEYIRSDRYWRVIYPSYLLFKSHYDACINVILNGNPTNVDIWKKTEVVPDSEPSEQLKDQVKSRDGHRCLCCGYDKQGRQLQVDHISPKYYGGNNLLDNLQSLCKTCNGQGGKGIKEISFRNNQTILTQPPVRLPAFETPAGPHAKGTEWWEMFLRRTINLFFQCSAVDTVEIGGRGEGFRHWRIRLFPGNSEDWLKPHLPALAKRIRQAREEAGYQAAPDEITVTESNRNAPESKSLPSITQSLNEAPASSGEVRGLYSCSLCGRDPGTNLIDGQRYCNDCLGEVPRTTPLSPKGLPSTYPAAHGPYCCSVCVLFFTIN